MCWTAYLSQEIQIHFYTNTNMNQSVITYYKKTTENNHHCLKTLTDDTINNKNGGYSYFYPYNK